MMVMEYLSKLKTRSSDRLYHGLPLVHNLSECSDTDCLGQKTTTQLHQRTLKREVASSKHDWISYHHLHLCLSKRYPFQWHQHYQHYHSVTEFKKNWQHEHAVVKWKKYLELHLIRAVNVALETREFSCYFIEISC